ATTGVGGFPMPVGHWAQPAEARFGTRALVSLLRDALADVIQVEREPTTRGWQQVVRVARKLKLPVVLFTFQNVEVSLPLFPRVRRRRALRRLRGAIAGSAGAAALLRRAVPDLPVAIVPQFGVQVRHEPEHERR